MTAGERTGARGVTEHARTRPDHPAIVTGPTVLTYGALQDRAARLAAVLRDRGAGPGRPVATVLPNGAEQFEVATAASMLDAPYLPVNRHLKAAELAYIFDDAEAAVVVGHADLVGELDPGVESSTVTTPALVVGRDYEPAIAGADPLPGADSGSGPGLMFYTSGTTARPEGRGARGDGRPRAPAAGHRGPGGAVAVDARRGVRDERALLPRLPCRLGPVRPLHRGDHGDHRAVRGPLVAGRGRPDPGDAVVHGARPLHPDPRDPRGGARRHGPVQPPPHRPRRGALPGRGQTADDGGLPPHRDPRALRSQRRGRHQDLARRVAGPPRERRTALAGGRDPDPLRPRGAAADRRDGPGVHPAPRGEPVLLPQRPGGDRARLAGRRLHRRRHRPPRCRGVPHHHRPRLGHGAVGRRQHRPPGDRRGPLRASGRGRLCGVRHPRRARRRAGEGHGAAPEPGHRRGARGARAEPAGRLQGAPHWEIVDDLPRDQNGKVRKHLLRRSHQPAV